MIKRGQVGHFLLESSLQLYKVPVARGTSFTSVVLTELVLVDK